MQKLMLVWQRKTNLTALRTNDSRVAYQEALEPMGGRCPVPTCSQEIKDIFVKERWKSMSLGAPKTTMRSNLASPNSASAAGGGLSARHIAKHTAKIISTISMCLYSSNQSLSATP